MPHLTLPMSGGEPVVRLVVGVSLARAAALRVAGLPVPPPVVLRALIDTGASGTVVHSDSIQGLAVPPTGMANIHTPSTARTSVQCHTYDLGLAVVHHGVNFLIGSRRVIATDLTGNGIEALIGCDVLATCLLIYDGVNQTFTLAF